MLFKKDRLAECGFTLVETIAVAGALAISGLVALPALSRASQQGSSSQCLRNAKQLALAAQVYAGDHDELWPGNGVSDIYVNFADPPADYVARVWAEGNERNFFPEAEARQIVSPRLSLLASYLPEDKKAFRCPADQTVRRVGSTVRYRPRSYGLNIFVGWVPPLFHGEPNAGSRVFLRTAQVLRPADIFLFGEIHPFSICDPPFGVHPRWDGNGNPMGANASFHVPANFHDRATTFAMADGHAELHRWIEPQFNDPRRGGVSLPATDAFWHNHEGPLPGVTAKQVEFDFKWLSVHTTAKK